MTMAKMMFVNLLLLSSSWAAGFGLFELRQFLKRRTAKRSQDQAQEQPRKP
jgi:hypothetical protein